MNTRKRRFYASVMAQIHQNWRVVAGRLAFPLVPDNLGACDPSSQRGGGQNEVDAHPLPLWESQLGVVPIGVDPGTGGEWPYHIGELSVHDSVERLALRLRDMCAALVELDAPDVVVGRGDVPVADQRDLCRWIVA